MSPAHVSCRASTFKPEKLIGFSCIARKFLSLLSSPAIVVKLNIFFIHPKATRTTAQHRGARKAIKPKSQKNNFMRRSTQIEIIFFL
jgi:hypothetical protein